MDRRQFLKRSGAGAAALGLASCKSSTPAASSSTDPSHIGRMEMRQCGDESVSILGYGCMRWQNKKDPTTGQPIIDQDSVNELVDYALEHGVNYFDTAPVYIGGKSEEATALALKRHPRESYYIATKASNFSAYDYDNSVQMYRHSLEVFGTDHIDYYLLHSLSGGEEFVQRFESTGFMDYLLRQRELGHIRHLGFSFHGDRAGFDELMALHERYHWDFVQIQMNYYDWSTDNGRNAAANYLYSELDRREIPVVIMEPLLGGRLSSVPESIARSLKEREPDRSVASWAFRFCATYPRVLTILSGMTYMEHLRDNLESLCDFKPLTSEELEFLEDIKRLLLNYPLIPCTACQYCMPCPYGLDIPGIFMYYNKAVNEGTFPTGQAQQGYSRLRRRYLAGYSEAIPPERQADHCIGCRQCEEHCPQKIQIHSEMERVDRYIEKLKQNILL